MINKNTSIICQCLSDSKIPHIVGGSSLLGLTTGVLTKYTNNISLYIFNYNQYKIFFLFFRLLKNGILLKPKFNKLGILRFKLRKKNSIFENNLEYCTLFPGKIENNNYKFFIGGRYIYFESDDLQSNKLSQIKIKKFTYTVPQNYHEFNEKYNDNLFSGIYRNFSVSFNSKTEIDIKHLEAIENRMLELNAAIENDDRLGVQFQVGHSYVTPAFDSEITDVGNWFKQVVETEIYPLLEEYWFDDPKKAVQQKDALLKPL